MSRRRVPVENLRMSRHVLNLTMRNAIGLLLVAAVLCGLSQSDLLLEGELILSPGEAVNAQEVTDVDYVADPDDPEMVSKVTFTVLPAPSADTQMTIRLEPKGAWYRCSSRGSNVVCLAASSPIALEDVVELQVVAN